LVGIGLAGRRDFDIGGRCIWKLGCVQGDKLHTDTDVGIPVDNYGNKRYRGTAVTYSHLFLLFHFFG